MLKHPKVVEFARNLLAQELAQCTAKQQETFKLMYPNGVRLDQLDWAISQCERTNAKNALPAQGNVDG